MTRCWGLDPAAPSLSPWMMPTFGDSRALWASGAAALQPTVVFVLGGPGAGKGTMCGKMAEEYGW